MTTPAPERTLPCPKCEFWEPRNRHYSIAKSRIGAGYVISCSRCQFMIDGLINPRAALRAWNAEPRKK